MVEGWQAYDEMQDELILRTDKRTKTYIWTYKNKALLRMTEDDIFPGLGWVLDLSVFEYLRYEYFYK